MSSRAVWLALALTASCAVKGFTIADELPGGNASGSGGSGSNESGASGGGKTNQAGSTSGGDGTGAQSQGGKMAQAGNSSQAGSAMAGEGSDQAGAGGVGSDEPLLAACAKETDGASPLFCDDLESPTAPDPQKWLTSGASVMIEQVTGPQGTLTNAMRLELQEARTIVQGFDYAVEPKYWVSFWLKVLTLQDFAAIITFGSMSGQNAHMSLMLEPKGFYWQSITQTAPGQPMNAVPNTGWVCIELELTATSSLLSYWTPGVPTPKTLLVDDTATPGVDDTWQNQPASDRHIAGYPAFGGGPNQLHGTLLIDDVRISTDGTHVCPN